MSDSATPSNSTPPAAPRSVLQQIFRIGFPQIIVVLVPLILFAISRWPDKNVSGSSISMARTMTYVIGATVLILWALFFSGWKKLYVLLFLGSLVGGTLSVAELKTASGDVDQELVWRPWVERLLRIGHDDRLDDHRKAQGPVTATVNFEEATKDWPSYRGADRTGIVTGAQIATSWEKNPPREIWKQPIGGGYASFAAANGFLVTIEQRRDKEAVVCYEAATGFEVWAHSWNASFKEQLGGDGPRATPTIDHGEVFALGATGHLVCLDGKSGTEKWSVEILAGNKNIWWGMSGAPLVYDDLVVVNPGVQTPEAAGRGVVAFDRKTGKEVWAAGKATAGYSSPMLVTLLGVSQVVVFDGKGVSGYDARKGTELWRFLWTTMQDINVAQPIIIGEDQLFIASGYDVGGALIKLSKSEGKWTADQVWRTKQNVMRCKFTSPIRYQDAIYGLNDGRLECISLKDGKSLWKDDRRPKEETGSYGHGQIILINDQLVILTEFGEIVLVSANPGEFQELGRQKVLTGKKTWSSPTFMEGRLYLRNEKQMACVGLR